MRSQQRICLLISFLLAVLITFLPITISFAATLGPVSSFDGLRDLLQSANNGDVILISGALDASGEAPLSPPTHVRITSADYDTASIRHLQILNGDVTLSNLSLEGSLKIGGTSNILLTRGTSVTGSDGMNGISFAGNGTLILEPGSVVTGGSCSAGISIEHQHGDFFASLEGSVVGGSGETGGTGVVIFPLCDSGAVMISGSVIGGKGSSIGGHALNLYELSGNAYVTVNGKLQGGSGSIGGDGIHLISASDNTVVGIAGNVKGGRGEFYGGDALILMNASDSSSFHLSGSFSGGDAIGPDAQPGTSLTLVGHAASLRTFVGDCFLEDGKRLDAVSQMIAPSVTPLPGIITSVDDIEQLEEPLSTEMPSAPEIASAAQPSLSPEQIPFENMDTTVSESDMIPSDESEDASESDDSESDQGTVLTPETDTNESGDKTADEVISDDAADNELFSANSN